MFTSKPTCVESLFQLLSTKPCYGEVSVYLPLRKPAVRYQDRHSCVFGTPTAALQQLVAPVGRPHSSRLVVGNSNGHRGSVPALLGGLHLIKKTQARAGAEMPWLMPDTPKRLCSQSCSARFCHGTPASLVHGGLWARDRSCWGLCQLPLGPVLTAEPASHPRCTPGGFLVAGGSRPFSPEFLPRTWWCPLPFGIILVHYFLFSVKGNKTFNTSGP